MNTLQKNSPDKAKISVSVDAGIKPLLDLMLKKANLNMTDLTDTFIVLWIRQNKDLLSQTELEAYKHLFVNQ
jgi:hypothetical protein